MPLDSQTATLRIQPTGGPLGADIHGIDLSREIAPSIFDVLAEAWAQHLVLRFSDNGSTMRA